MLINRMIKYIETHTAGSPTRHLLGGAPRMEGGSIPEKMAYMRGNHDWLRRLVMMEPRGHSGMSGALYVEPCHPEADMGIVYFDACDYMEMCGHSTIAIATVLAETGMVTIGEKGGAIVLDTPAGLVRTTVHKGPHAVDRVSFENVPSFLYDSRPLDIPGRGRVTVDVSFGGMAYAIVQADELGVRVDIANLDELVAAAQAVHAAARTEIGFRHPEKPFIDRIHSVMIVDKPVRPDADCKEVVILIPAEKGNALAIDRSPCGTGTSARIAAEYAKGTIRLDQSVGHESITGTLFTGKIVRETTVGPHRGGIPEITGSAYVTASGEFLLDSRDQFQEGFLLV